MERATLVPIKARTCCCIHTGTLEPICCLTCSGVAVASARRPAVADAEVEDVVCVRPYMALEAAAALYAEKAAIGVPPACVRPARRFAVGICG